MAAAHRQVIHELPYAPRRIFLPFHTRKQRWAALVAHRRCGKTVACVNDIIGRALAINQKDGRFAYIAPFFNQAKDVAWTYLKRYAEPVLAGPPNETELRVDLVTGSRIRLYGADNPDRLRGLYFDGVVLDEFADMGPSLWGEVIRPLLADRQGWATFIGTPKGHNQLFDIFEYALAHPSDWFSGRFRASETGILQADELADARRDMTPEQFEQEFEASFEAAILGAYLGKEMAEAERAGRITGVPRLSNKPVHTAWDLGNGPNMAIWCFQIDLNEIRVIDFLSASGMSMKEYCAELAVRGYDGTDWVPHDAKTPSMETGRTRVETLIDMGRKPRLVPEIKVDDGINAARLTLPHCWFDRDKCKYGIEALKQYRAEFDEKAKVFRNYPKKDWATHPADAFRYLAVAWRGEKPPPLPLKDKGPMTINQVTIDEMWKLAENDRPRDWI